MHRTLSICLILCTVAIFDVASAQEASNDTEATRDERGLMVFYDFADADGDRIKDRTGNGFDLKIKNTNAVRRSPGKLQVVGDTTIATDRPTRKLVGAIRGTRELTIEAWIKPANLNQSGPARIVSLSSDSTHRNFTLGQEGKEFAVRLRTTKTSENGLPAMETKDRRVKQRVQHVVYTRNRNGKAKIFLNGERIAQTDVGGDLSNWDDGHKLALGNEINGGRKWQGTYHLVALYKRALSKSEIEKNFQAGPGAGTEGPQNLVKVNPAERHFETKIAPILANHCLECHDAGSHKGGLVLSTKKQAFAGGESGDAIVAGKADDSLVWLSVEADDMPHDRPALSAKEKKLLKEWIDKGATWSIEELDAAVYAHLDETSQNFVRRLTVDEYIATVKAVVGVDISKEARKLLPGDLRADGFSNTAYNLNVDLRHVEAYTELAQIIVSRMDVPAFADRFAKKRDFTDKTMRGIIGRLGKAIYRGPLDDDEITALRGVTTTVAASSGSVDEALGFVIEAMLQSPRFLYRVENQQGGEEGWYVDGYELASRLSYLIWGGPPDDVLLKAAENGELGPDGCRKQVERMLKDDRAVAHSKRFVSDWLNLKRLTNLSPNKERFPGWSKELAADMRSETLAFWEQIVWKEQRPLGDLMNAQVAFATPRLARHYGLTPGYQPGGSEGGDEAKSDSSPKLTAYDVSSVPGRGGLLTQGSILTVGGDDASTVTRGLFVMHELLRGIVKDPPPGVDTTPIPAKEGVSKRAIAMTRIDNKNCGGCHERFEPLSFGLEKFNGIGAYIERDEHGNTQEDHGEILFPGQPEPKPFKNASELMDLLASSKRVQQSLTWKVTQFAVGRPLGPSDARSVNKIHSETEKNGGTYQSLLTAIALSDLVQMAK